MHQNSASLAPSSFSFGSFLILLLALTTCQNLNLELLGNLGAADNQFDLRFINAMLPHHQGAVTMAKEALEKSDRPEIKKLAQDIISSQQQEIAQMHQWRKAWYEQ